MTAVLATGGVLLLAMIAVSVYGWVSLPADARVPIHFGVGYNNFVAKSVALVVYPAIGILVYVLFAANAHKSSKPSVAIISPIIMGVLVIVQLGAIRVARRSGTQ
jgi:hypothetical protein